MWNFTFVQLETESYLLIHNADSKMLYKSHLKKPNFFLIKSS